MAKNKRVNPRRRPVTMATVNKMREDVKEEAVSDSVVKGYVSVQDLKSVLFEEYGINIT